MTPLWQSLRRRGRERDISLQDAINLGFFGFGGHDYEYLPTSTLGSGGEEIGSDYRGIVQGAYKSNGIVFACVLARMMLFSESRFAFRRWSKGRPGDLFTTDALSLIQRPYPGGKTSHMMSRALQDADIAGNWYGARRKGGVRRLRPDWVTILMGSESDPDNAGVAADTEVIGYIYHPGGRGSQAKVETYLVEEVAHWAPVPDPEAAFRGMSWLVPVIREVAADREMAKHQIKFFEQGATPNMVVSYGLDIEPEQFDAWVKAFKADHEGTVNAYKTLFLAGGANVEVVGANLKDVDFSQVKGHGETRIAAAAGVPPIIAGFSEGLQAATYSNYGQARRRFADLTMRPLWEGMAGALETIVDVPDDQTELWYDVRDVFFLQEDEQDRANIQQTQAQAARTYIDAGYNPDSVIAALEADDITRLVHSGLFSVQLQKAGAVDGDMADDDDDPPILDNGDRELGRSALAALAEMLRER